MAALVVMCMPLTTVGQIYPRQQFANGSTGYLETEVAGEYFRGSGVIARDPRLIYSCAHVLFEDGRWATSYFFSPGWNDYKEPSSANGVSPRGFRHFASYAGSVDTFGTDDRRTFGLDFTILYDSANIGPAVARWADGGAVLRTTTRRRRIAGYPATIDFTNAPGYAYQHVTPWFYVAPKHIYGAYYRFTGVSTGSGNSGGPVFVWDAVAKRDRLAGILVSGGVTNAGVYALDAAAEQMATAALTDSTANLDPGSGTEAAVTHTYRNSQALRIPDAARAYSERSVSVSGFTGGIQTLAFSVRIVTTYRADLDVYLVSPSGRIRWISKHQGGAADDLDIVQADYSTQYLGTLANGVWRQRIRDTDAGDQANFRDLEITIGAPGI